MTGFSFPDLLAILGSLGALIAFIAYYSLKGRTIANKDLADIQRRASDEASKLVETLEKRMNIMEFDLKKSNQHIADLEGQVKVLRDQNGRTHTLIVEALVHYFEGNPEKAEAFGKEAVGLLKRTITN